MNKTNKKSLKKSADTLISVTTRLIGELEEQESYSAEEVERLSVAFSCALSAVSAMEKTPSKEKKAKEEHKKEAPAVGRIELPPVMEREA